MWGWHLGGCRLQPHALGSNWPHAGSLPDATLPRGPPPLSLSVVFVMLTQVAGLETDPEGADEEERLEKQVNELSNRALQCRGGFGALGEEMRDTCPGSYSQGCPGAGLGGRPVARTTRHLPPRGSLTLTGRWRNTGKFSKHDNVGLCAFNLKCLYLVGHGNKDLLKEESPVYPGAVCSSRGVGLQRQRLAGRGLGQTYRRPKLGILCAW